MTYGRDDGIISGGVAVGPDVKVIKVVAIGTIAELRYMTRSHYEIPASIQELKIIGYFGISTTYGTIC